MSDVCAGVKVVGVILWMFRISLQMEVKVVRRIVASATVVTSIFPAVMKMQENRYSFAVVLF